MDSSEVLRRKQLCSKFLQKEDIGRPLIGLMWEPAILPVQSYVDRIDLSIPALPEDINGEEMCRECDSIIRHSDSIPQDFFYSVQASFNHLWLSAALGCTMKVTTDTIWSEPPDISLGEIAGWNIDVRGKWIDKLVECHKMIVAHVNGRTAVAVPWLDGPLDLLVSLLGPEETAMALVDDTDLFPKAMDKLTDFVIQVTELIAKSTPVFADGYVSRMHIYTQDVSPTVMDDATWMASKENFLKKIYPFEKRIIDIFPGSVYHMHNTSTQITDILGKSALKAVQYTIDPNGPDWEIQIKAISELQELKPVVLSCWNLEDAERARRDLASKGLAITLVLETMPDRSPEPKLLKKFSEWYLNVLH